MAKPRKSSSRKRRRGGNAPMPMGGAGLIRFFEDSSQGFKIGPIWTVSLAGILILIVILARAGIFELLGLGF